MTKEVDKKVMALTLQDITLEGKENANINSYALKCVYFSVFFADCFPFSYFLCNVFGLHEYYFRLKSMLTSTFALKIEAKAYFQAFKKSYFKCIKYLQLTFRRMTS